ncbi:MAG TPA: hypothetical protein VN541_19015, partial [Tepidisphaeraceae bacterium]|nr:hypothetical protein [Tepidisphaeraceae bacterium]
WAAERAPQELREQIVALCPDLNRRLRKPTPQPLSMRIRSAVYGLAVAATFLLAVGLLFHVWDIGNARHGPHIKQLPPDLAQLIIDRHEQTASSADPKTPGIPQDDQGKMEKAMQQKVGFPVLTASLGGSWRFQGASITKVGNSNAAELLFERVTTRRQHLSLFSLPLSFAGIEQSCQCDYSQVQNKHPIAGFATNNGFYCVVTDDSVTLDEVRVIRDQLRPKMDQPIASAPMAAIGN